MNRQLKKGLQKAFEAPEPDQQEKKRFLGTLPQPQIRLWQFVLIQAAYLRKRTLFLSVLLLFPAMAGACGIDLDTLWTISALIPFLGFLAVAESTRSVAYGMDEFEMSTRFSLKSVLLARMSILGMLDALILFGLIPLCCIGSDFSVLQTGIYLFVPYMLTVNISLWITRHFHGRDGMYACVSVAVLVSAANAGLHIMADFVYQSGYIKWWLILSVLLVVEMIYETCSTMMTAQSWHGRSSGRFLS